MTPTFSSNRDPQLQPYKWVKRYFKRRRKLWCANARHDGELLGVAALMAFATISLFVTAGYHAAFFTLQDTGLMLFSSAAWANITFMGDTVSALAIALLFTYRFPHLVLATLASALICTIMVHSLKAGVGTLRPPGVLPSDMLHVIGPAYKGNSFPSGHTATAFVMAGLLTRCFKTFQNRAAMLLLALTIAWSRVACGVHWPIDVLVGGALGLISAWMGLRLTDGIKLRVWGYTPIAALMLACAGYLWFHDGGFDATRITAPVLGAVVVIYWVSSWGYFFAVAHHRSVMRDLRRAGA
mgnify:FL=1